ncbi:MAG: replicative DNA helicase [Lentisphaerae bacterium]|nr:replicative DNA helicase [Lentisphaerota bacterium]
MSTASGAPGAVANQERKSLFNEDAERGVLGAVLLDAAKVMDLCIERQIAADSFYGRAHQVIYAAMQDMAKALRPIDVLTLADRLSGQGKLDAIGGAAYLNHLLDAIPTAAHAEYYIDMVRQQHLLRRIVDCARLAEHKCCTSDQDADHILAEVEQDFFGISGTPHGAMLPWSATVKQTMGLIEQIKLTGKGLSGIPTGFKDLDEMLLGLHNEELIVLAGRPSMGKTSLAMNIVEQVALGRADNQPRPVGIFSLEMAREQLVLRMLSSHAAVPAHKIAAGMISPASHGLLMQAADVMMKAPIFLDDTGGLEILELRARARRMKKRHGIELLVVDYLQLLHARERSREGRQQEIAFISGSLKNMAKELKIPVLALSQLNRAPEARDREGEPRLADLRDSGAIEQDADVVCLLYRPSKYREDTKDKQALDSGYGGDDLDANPNVAQVIVAKQRNGPTGRIRLVFREEVIRFESMAPAVLGEEALSVLEGEA